MSARELTFRADGSELTIVVVRESRGSVIGSYRHNVKHGSQNSTRSSFAIPAFGRGRRVASVARLSNVTSNNEPARSR
jgi:hypothetical protein